MQIHALHISARPRIQLHMHISMRIFHIFEGALNVFRIFQQIDSLLSLRVTTRCKIYIYSNAETNFKHFCDFLTWIQFQNADETDEKHFELIHQRPKGADPLPPFFSLLCPVQMETAKMTRSSQSHPLFNPLLDARYGSYAFPGVSHSHAIRRTAGGEVIHYLAAEDNRCHEGHTGQRDRSRYRVKYICRLSLSPWGVYLPRANYISG